MRKRRTEPRHPAGAIADGGLQGKGGGRGRYAHLKE
jgi:hypothetical protein